MPQRQARLRRGPHKARGDQQPGDNEEETEPLHARAFVYRMVYALYRMVYALYRMAYASYVFKRYDEEEVNAEPTGEAHVWQARVDVGPGELRALAHCYSSLLIVAHRCPFC